MSFPPDLQKSFLKTYTPVIFVSPKQDKFNKVYTIQMLGCFGLYCDRYLEYEYLFLINFIFKDEKRIDIFWI